MATTASSPPLSESASPEMTSSTINIHRAASEDKAAEKRRRRRVDPSKRKRVSVACGSCKKRKQRCDGEEPCGICRRRGFECRRLSPDDAMRRASRERSSVHPRLRRHSPIPSPLIDHGIFTPQGTSAPNYVNSEEIVAVSRLLSDSRGHLRFIGESGVNSFLDQVRHLFRQTASESAFTLNVERYHIADGPVHHHGGRTLQLPSRAVADEMIDIFECRVQPFSYVFHMDELRRIVDETYQSPIDCPRSWLCLIHLVFALAAAYKPENDGSRYFESALSLCQDSLEDGDFWVVQAYLLISLYYQSISKVNALWVATAIRFGQALGLHRECANETTPPRERLLRRRVWRTLYILDRFQSAAVGRPFEVKDRDWDDRDASDNAEEDRLQVELTRLAQILGDICQDIYHRRTISTQAASALARRLQQWSDNLLPHMTVNSLLDDITTSSDIRQALLRLHLSHLHAVILLSRPFFFYVVATAVTNRPAGSASPAETTRGTVARLARACVLAATKSVELIQTVFRDIVGIILLLEAYRDRSFLRSASITGVKVLMRSYIHVDLTAKRTYHIFEDMEIAIRDEEDKRQSLEARDILADLLGGSVGPADGRHPSQPLRDTTSPGSLGLSQVLLDGAHMSTNVDGGDAVNFDFDSLAYWDSMAAGGHWDFGGMLFNAEIPL